MKPNLKLVMNRLMAILKPCGQSQEAGDGASSIPTFRESRGMSSSNLATPAKRHLDRKAALMALSTFTLALVVAGCASVVQPYAVRKGTARDFIFSVEPLNNAAVRVWLRSDNMAAYCVTQPELAARFTDAIVNWNGEVLVTYHSLSPVEQKAREWVLAGCGTFSGTNASTFELYNVDDMKLVSGRPDNSGR